MAVIEWRPPQGNKQIAEAAFGNYCAALAEAQGTRDFAKHEAARKAYSVYVRIPDDGPVAAEPERKAIRLRGEHTYHAAGTVLVVTDNEAVACNSPHAVARQHAHALVASGRAEWVISSDQAG